MDANKGANKTQLTTYSENPVRFLSVSDNNTLCYGLKGEIYTKTGKEGKLNINIRIDHTSYKNTFLSKSSEATEM